MSLRIVHVIPAFSRGGGGRALLSLVRESVGCESTVVSLGPADVLMRAEALAAGAAVVEGPAAAELERAAIVHVHFWNTPELYELLRAGLPEGRLALWAHVVGDTPPQILTRELVEFADAVALSAPPPVGLAVLARSPTVIPAAPDPLRLAATRKAHDGFAVGYVGTLDPEKLHPGFIELCDAVAVPGVRFVVCGSGAAARAIAAAGERFDQRGYVEDVGAVLAELDVFGYPLAPGNYSTSDLALQEAMLAGVPPVVLPHGATHRLVRHGETGLVAADEREYPRAIEQLHANPELRARLGRAAAARTRARGPAEVSAAWAELYAGLMERPPRALRWPGPTLAGAEAFLASLGGAAPEFAQSFGAAAEADALDAERRIAAATPALASAGTGGVLAYRRRYPGDLHLRLWSGLVLEAAGRRALAAGELAAALSLGPRVRGYLERATGGAVGATS